MPLPDTAITIDGGCNCGAIRYRVAVPERSERILHPLSTDPVPLPFLAFDHCNDCRKATGSILPTWLCALMNMCSVSLVKASTATLARKASDRGKDKEEEEEKRGDWMPAAQFFTPDPEPDHRDHFLNYYESSHQRWRWFCARCGTNVAYTAAMPDGFPAMLDLTMGSIQRSHLDSDALVPERHLWWDYGIDWIRKLATVGYGELPIHPDYHIDDTVKLQRPS